ITIVIVDFRKERLSLVLDADEIMLTPGVVLVIECIEISDLPEDHPLHRIRERIHAGRHHDAAAAEGCPEGIVQGTSPHSLGIFIFFLLISLTHVNLRRVTGAPTVRRRTRPRLPFLPFYSIAAVSGGARPAAPRLDRPRRAATDRDRARRHDIIRCRGLLGGDEADAAVAILALADFPKPVFRAQLVEPRYKLRPRQGHALRGTAPCLVVGIESAFRKRLRVRCRLDALGE